MELRDYQTKARDFLVSHRHGFVIAPAGSGKTVIGASAVQRVSPRLKKAVWLANTLEQVDQAVKALVQFPCNSDLDIQVECVAAQPDVRDADLLVMDEGHHAPADSWCGLLQQLKPGAILWGLSATPWHDKDQDRNTLLARTFKHFHEIDAEAVRESGHLCDGKVFVWDLDTEGEFDKAIHDLAKADFKRLTGNRYKWDDDDLPDPITVIRQRCLWRHTPLYVQNNPKRNAKIAELVAKECSSGESVLVLVASVDHGESLCNRCEPWGHLIHSKIGKKKREILIESMRSGAIRCLVATSLADEGLDIPRLSRVIMACGGRSSTKLTQRIGRVLRPFGDKTVGVCHDFLDRGAELANAQAWSRYSNYQELGYDVEIV